MTNQYKDSKHRRFVILKRLLSQEHLSYQQLSEEYFVSRSSIANDLSFIKKIFFREGLSLTFDNSGTYFIGNEGQIQKILRQIILKQLDAGASIAIFVDVDLMEQVSQAFCKTLEEKKIEIPENYMQNIIVSISLIIQRSKEKHKIETEGENQFEKLFLEFDKYPLVYDLLKDLEEQGIYKFSAADIQHLTYLIVGSGLKFFMKSENIPFSFRKKVRFLIQKVSEGIQRNLTQDNRLEEDLLVHLYQLVLRMKAQTSILNPLIDDIKQNYPSLYGVVWFALSDFGKLHQINLSDDEVGFVMIHFQASIERLKEINKLLFVCPNGIGISSFVSSKIRKFLPNVNSIETVSSSKLKKMDLSDTDLIISTVDIKNALKPVVTISPMVTAEDIKRIMNNYIDLIIERENTSTYNAEITREAKELISQKILFGTFPSKKEALNYLINQQNFSNELSKNSFTHSVWEREKLQSTYLDNGFAIPHGDSEYVEKTAISILLLDKPIIWSNQKVDVIVLLMIREEDTEKVEPVMKLVMQGIKDKNWFISKMMEAK